MNGEGLRLLRIYKKLKVKEVAELLGISPNYLSEIETGKKTPSIDVIERYADIFKTSPALILFFADLEFTEEKSKGKIKKIIRNKVFHLLQTIERDASDLLRD